MNKHHLLRKLIDQVLHTKCLTWEIEEQINDYLTDVGYIPDLDFEVLELLMTEMDAGRIRVV